MNMETLKIFCDLAELQSFSKTADKNFLSQSAISQQLAQLELVHKCQFFDRKKRPITLTKEGQLFYQAARDIIDRYEKFNNELNTTKSSEYNRVNIAAIFSIGMHALPNYVKKFMVKYPDVNVHIEFLNADKIYEQIFSGEIDIGLVSVARRDKRLVVYDFEEEPLVLVCSPKHYLARESQIDIHKLQFERFIGFTENIPTRIWIDEILKRYNIAVNPIMEFDNIETIKRAVEINSGISILPKITVLQEVANSTIKAIEFSNEHFVRPTGIIVSKNKTLSKPCRHFIDLLCRQS